MFVHTYLHTALEIVQLRANETLRATISASISLRRLCLRTRGVRVTASLEIRPDIPNRRGGFTFGGHLGRTFGCCYGCCFIVSKCEQSNFRCAPRSLFFSNGSIAIGIFEPHAHKYINNSNIANDPQAQSFWCCTNCNCQRIHIIRADRSADLSDGTCIIFINTLNGGSLGSWVDEERS